MQENKSDKLGTMPIGELLYKMSVPAVISMIIQALYNIVDSMYVAQLGQDALFAMGLVFPMQMLSLSVALGCGAGTNALLARRLGQKRQDHANQTATTGVLLALFHSLIILLIGIFASEVFLSMFTDNTEIISMGSTYLYIVMGFSLGQHIQIVCERILQATGNMIVPMIALMISALTNIILDPIFIFGYFGVPAMGIAGAALATVIGQWIGMFYILAVLFFKKHDVKVTFKNFKLELICINKIYLVGIPAMVMNAISSFTVTLLNTILVGFSDTAVNVLSIYFKVQSFVFMPIFGITNGAMPILAYNYGARNKQRFEDTIKLMLKVSLIIMIAGSAFFLFFPDAILGMFNPTPELLEIGRVSFRIICIHFVFAAVSIVLSSVFQALGLGVSSLALSVLRQIVLLVPLAYLFSQWIGLTGVWWSYLVAEVVVAVVFTPIALKAIKTRFLV